MAKILNVYKLLVSQGPDSEDMLGNTFGPPSNPNRPFVFENVWNKKWVWRAFLWLFTRLSANCFHNEMREMLRGYEDCSLNTSCFRSVWIALQKTLVFEPLLWEEVRITRIFTAALFKLPPLWWWYMKFFKVPRLFQFLKSSVFSACRRWLEPTY